MPKNKDVTAGNRHRRVRRLKLYSILIPAIILPNVLCIVLFVRVHRLNGMLEGLALQVEGVTQAAEEQRQRMEEFAEGLSLYSEGGSVAGESSGGRQEQISVNEVTVPEPEPSDQSGQPLHKVYLTFDDGPSIYTQDILEILDRYDVKATFFVVGKESDAAKEALTMIVDGGHTLGMHSYSHKYSELYESVEDFADDFVKLQSYLYEVTGVESKVYRFPGGSSNTVSDIDMMEFVEYLESQGVQYYDWNISSGDASSTLRSVDTLVSNSMTGIGENGTSIILLHDSADKRTTVEALPVIIESILALEDTEILPITEDTVPVQHIH